MAKALIVGAGSTIARALAARLAADHQLVAISRDRSSPDPVYHEHHSCDLSEAALADLGSRLMGRHGYFDLMLCALGSLHGPEHGPEKRLAELDEARLLHSFRVNAVLPALALKHLLPLLPKRQPARAVFLSAKIGGIGDNHLGGWYGYRASKAALNMLVRTASIELARSHRQLCLALVHPGTTDTPLSRPFTAGTPGDKLYSPQLTAERLHALIGRLGPEDTGRFFNWDGSALPW